MAHPEVGDGISSTRGWHIRKIQQIDMYEEFKIRCYSKRELAMMYARARKPRGRIRPETANRYFRRMLVRCKPILPELYALGYSDSSHTLSYRQVAVIVHYLGEP